MSKSLTIDAVDSVLPQTQCGLCGYAGCRPYAEALLKRDENIDRCPPGGKETLFALAKLFAVDPTPFIEKITQETKPPMVAVIREDECIGCTKCIAACPTDAILGSGKLMHTVITDACTGCELCVEPCPVDCIDLVTIEKRDKALEWRERYQKRNARITRLKLAEQQQHLAAKKTDDPRETVLNRQDAIQQAIARAKLKKQSHE